MTLRECFALCMNGNFAYILILALHRGMNSMGRRSSSLEMLIDQLFEITGYVWQIGAVVTAILAFCTYKAAMLANGLTEQPTSHITAVFERFSWFFYIVPVMLGVLTFLLFVKTLETYQRR